MATKLKPKTIEFKLRNNTFMGSTLGEYCIAKFDGKKFKSYWSDTMAVVEVAEYLGFHNPKEFYKEKDVIWLPDCNNLFVEGKKRTFTLAEFKKWIEETRAEDTK